MSHTPTAEQQAIIDFIQANPDTNLMIDAVAGAAKTSTVVMAAEHIPASLYPLAVAFNKKIAVELEGRLPSYFQCRTLNSIGHGAWQQARGGKRLIVDGDKLFKIVKAVVPAGDDPELFSTVLALTRAAKSAGLVPLNAPMKPKGVIPDTTDEWNELAWQKGLTDIDSETIFHCREVLLRSITAAFQGEIDYDDQIYMSVLFGGTYPKHHTVIVDESQDLSVLNRMQLERMVGSRLIAVGDPYQAIYAFRGADSESMNRLAEKMGDGQMGVYLEAAREAAGNLAPIVSHNLIGKGKFKRLLLTNSFRAPQVIGRLVRSHVPHFGCMPWLAEGDHQVWPLPRAEARSEEHRAQPSWSIDDIPREDAFVLCRNNAPLMALAFILIKNRRPVNILGRDIGASLATLLLKITGKRSLKVEDCWPKLEDWKTKEIAKAGDSESKRETIYDRYDALHVLLDAGGKPDNLTSAEFIKELFTDKVPGTMLTLASGHRSKGLERGWVMHLDPHRVPSNFAIKADRKGNPGPLQQELNLEYVIRTRTQHTFVEASLDDCAEGGEG